MGDLSWWHWLIVVFVFVLLFGSKRLPDAARSLGKSMRILKTEIKGMQDDDAAEPAPTTAPTAATPPAALPPPAAPADVPTTATPSTATAPTSDSPDAR